MFRKSFARLGGHGDLFPVTKDGHLSPKFVLEREILKPAAKGKRYASTVKEPKDTKYSFTAFAPVHQKKIVEIPKCATIDKQVQGVSKHMCHKKLQVNEIAAANILEKLKSEKHAKERTFGDNKKAYVPSTNQTGDVVELGKFFESWVLDHRCLLNENKLGLQPVKMPWEPVKPPLV